MISPPDQSEANVEQGGALQRLEGPQFCSTAPLAPPPYKGEQVEVEQRTRALRDHRDEFFSAVGYSPQTIRHARRLNRDGSAAGPLATLDILAAEAAAVVDNVRNC
jgi:hypothetical protein